MTEIGEKLHAHVAELFPICRSITGEGLRATLRYIGNQIPLRLTEVPSGTPVLDWEVPPEWTLRAATVETRDGRRVIDAARHNLHIVRVQRAGRSQRSPGRNWTRTCTACRSSRR